MRGDLFSVVEGPVRSKDVWPTTSKLQCARKAGAHYYLFPTIQYLGSKRLVAWRFHHERNCLSRSAGKSTKHESENKCMDQRCVPLRHLSVLACNDLVTTAILKESRRLRAAARCGIPLSQDKHQLLSLRSILKRLTMRIRHIFTMRVNGRRSRGFLLLAWHRHVQSKSIHGGWCFFWVVFKLHKMCHVHIHMHGKSLLTACAFAAKKNKKPIRNVEKGIRFGMSGCRVAWRSRRVQAQVIKSETYCWKKNKKNQSFWGWRSSWVDGWEHMLVRVYIHTFWNVTASSTCCARDVCS